MWAISAIPTSFSPAVFPCWTNFGNEKAWAASPNHEKVNSTFSVLGMRALQSQLPLEWLEAISSIKNHGPMKILKGAELFH